MGAAIVRGDVIGAAYVVGAIIGCAIGAEIIVGAAIVRGAAYVVGAAIGAANVVGAAIGCAIIGAAVKLPSLHPRSSKWNRYPEWQKQVQIPRLLYPEVRVQTLRRVYCDIS